MKEPRGQRQDDVDTPGPSATRPPSATQLPSATHLVIFNERKLAHEIASNLQECLADDGQHAQVLVPQTRGMDFLAALGGQAERWSNRTVDGGLPLLVAQSEEGLLEQLRLLRLSAYVAVPRMAPRRVRRWDGGGAILLPAWSVREFVDGVRTHTPWPCLCH